MNFSYYKYILYLKLLRYKINYFIPNNTIEFIVAHYNESFEYLKYLPKNQITTIYYKGDKKLSLPKNNLNIYINKQSIFKRYIK